MIADVLGVDYLEHRLLERNIDQEEDDYLEHRLLAGHSDQEEIEEEPAKEFIDHDDLANKLEQYYIDQKESDLKVFEYYKENYSNERVWEQLRYRWEFMRRSPDYINAFEQEKIIDEKKNPSFNLFKRFEFWKSFGLICSELPDPNLSFEELQSVKNHNITDEPFFRINFVSKNYRASAGISYFTYLDEEIDFNEFNKLQFMIDFSKLPSIDILKKIVGRLLDDHWNDYHKRVGHKKKSNEMAVYELILKVGDLKEKDGLTRKEIAEEIFQDTVSFKSAKRKVSLYFKRYKDLINGGYRNL